MKFLLLGIAIILTLYIGVKVAMGANGDTIMIFASLGVICWALAGIVMDFERGCEHRDRE